MDTFFYWFEVIIIVTVTILIIRIFIKSKSPKYYEGYNHACASIRLGLNPQKLYDQFEEHKYEEDYSNGYIRGLIDNGAQVIPNYEDSKG